MFKRCVGVVLFVLVATNVYAQKNDRPLIPVVPAAQAKAGLNELPKRKSQYSPVAIKDSTVVTIKPGVNEIVAVAVNHLNRIVTPFENPRVKTSTAVTSEISDNVIYIGTTNNSPMTLFITEKGSEEKALSLTLIPKKIPPREITLRMEGSGSAVATTYTNKKAVKWEKTMPYMNLIEKLFSAIALGELPPGYKFEHRAVGRLPICRQNGLEFNFNTGQTVIGHKLIVHIGTATNVSAQPVEFIEDTCGDWDVAAAAGYPLNVLRPGQQTEIYIAKKRNQSKPVKTKRPSLLLGAR